MPLVNPYRTIETPRLLIRTLKRGDAFILRDLFARNRNYMLPWIDWAVNEPTSVKIKEDEISDMSRLFKAGIKFSYGIFLEDNLVGVLYLFTRQGPGTIEIGYMTDFEYYGMGIATEASYAAIKLAIEELKVDKVLFIINHDNKPSKKIPQRLGCSVTGKKIIEPTFGLKKSLENDIWSIEAVDFDMLDDFEPTKFYK